MFLEDFHAHWPTDQKNLYVDLIRDGIAGFAYRRDGETRWRRKAEEIARAKSAFHFDVTGRVAEPTHACLPFLRAIRLALPALHIWPFDGWNIPSGCAGRDIPGLWAADYPSKGRTHDQRDAFVAASWLRDSNQDGRLVAALQPELGEEALRLARYEGWILGVVADETSMPKRRNTQHTSPANRDTTPGYSDRNDQIVAGPTGRPGTDHNQQIYHMHCGSCGLNYGANGSDIHMRKCPRCGGGAPGLVV